MNNSPPLPPPPSRFPLKILTIQASVMTRDKKFNKPSKKITGKTISAKKRHTRLGNEIFSPFGGIKLGSCSPWETAHTRA